MRPPLGHFCPPFRLTAPRLVVAMALGCVGCPQPVDAAAAAAPSTTTTGAAPTRPDFDPAQVRTAVSALLTTQAKDWSAGRLEAFCDGYAEDAVFVSPKGVTRGRAEIFARYDKRYRQDGKAMGQLTLTVVDIDAQPGHASVVMKWHLAFDADPAGEAKSDGPTESQGHSLVTLRQRASGAWEIIHDASM